MPGRSDDYDGKTNYEPDLVSTMIMTIKIFSRFVDGMFQNILINMFMFTNT